MTERELGRWIAILKSGPYLQYQYKLSGKIKGTTGYCCLGVLARIRAAHYLEYPQDLPIRCRQVVVALNDQGFVDQYKRVIQELESAPEEYITE